MGVHPCETIVHTAAPRTTAPTAPTASTSSPSTSRRPLAMPPTIGSPGCFAFSCSRNASAANVYGSTTSATRSAPRVGGSPTTAMPSSVSLVARWNDSISAPGSEAAHTAAAVPSSISLSPATMPSATQPTRCRGSSSSWTAATASAAAGAWSDDRKRQARSARSSPSRAAASAASSARPVAMRVMPGGRGRAGRPAMRARGCRARWVSAGRRRRRWRRQASPTRSSSATAGPAASASPDRRLLAILDESYDPRRRLLDREVGDVDDGAAEAPVHERRLLELLVHLEQLRIALRRPHGPRAYVADLREPLGVDGQPDDLLRRRLEELPRRRDSLHDRHVRHLVPEVAQVNRQRRLRGSGDADEDHVRLVQPACADAVVVLDGELDRLHALEIVLVECGPDAGRHPCVY